MELKKFNIEDTKHIYNTYMTVDFPSSELKSLKKIVRLMELDKYFSFGVYEGENLVGYAFFMTNENMVLLDYFAIMKDKRNDGYGSKSIALISDYFKDKYDVLVLESEDPNFGKNETDKKIRQRRVNFYKKNNFKIAEIESKVYTVEFVVFTINNKLKNTNEVAKALYNLYVAMSNEEKCRENVFISVK